MAVTFVNLFIWQSSQNLMHVLWFNLFVFLGIPLAAMMSGYISEKTNTRMTYTIGLTLYVFELVIIILLKNDLSRFLPLVGFITGLAVGAQAFSHNVICELITTPLDRERFYGKKGVLQNMVYLIFPPLLAYISVRFSFLLLFAIVIVIFLAAVILTLSLSLAETPDRFELKQIIQIPGTNPDKLALLKIKFLFGVQNGLFWSVLGIILLTQIGSLVGWGFVTSFLTLLALIATFILSHKETAAVAQFVNITSAFVFAIAGILLAVNFDLPALLFYMLVQTLLGVALTVNFDATINNLIEEDTEISHLRKEYHVLAEIAVGAGRLLPIGVLLLFKSYLASLAILRIPFLVIALVPLLTMQTLFQTRFVKQKLAENFTSRA